MAFFAMVFGVICLAAPDYGVGWDEPIQRDYGELVIAYVTGQNQDLLTHRDRYHGPILEWIYVGAERLFDLSGPEVFQARHLWGGLLFGCGVVGLFVLGWGVFGHWGWGLLAAVMLWISPRQFAHGFFNSKDIPFMVMSIWGLLFAQRLIVRPSPMMGLFAGSAAAVLISIRVLGVLLPVLTLGFWAVYLCFISRHRIDLRLALTLIIYGVSLGGVTILAWPVLWDAPLTHFWAAITEMSHYPWLGTVLYLGDFVRADNLPWHYALVWMAVTIPAGYLVAGLVGLLGGVIRLKRHGVSVLRQDIWMVLVLLWLIVPLGLVIGLRSNLYDGWRHLYFVYPAFLIFAVWGVYQIADAVARRFGRSAKNVKIGLAGAGGMYVLAIAGLMVFLHPYQHVFFNVLAGPPSEIRFRFELDYWGTAYREGLDAILKIDQKDQVRVLAANFPGHANAKILPVEKAERLVFVPKPNQADYFITNYRWHPKDYPLPEVHAVYAGRQKILGVYRMY